MAELAAALTNPLFRVLAAVDGGDAVAHPDRNQGGRHGGSTAGEGTVQVRTLAASDPEPERVSDLSQNGLSQNGYGLKNRDMVLVHGDVVPKTAK